MNTINKIKVADETYDIEDTQARSEIQEILNNIPTGGSGDNWELIQDVTLEEDVPIVMFTNLNHKKVFMSIKCVGTDANTSTPNGQIEINNDVILYSNVLVQKAGVTRWINSYVEVCGGAIRFTSAVCNNNSYQSTTIGNGCYDKGTPIQKIDILAMGGHSASPLYRLGKGTEIKVYGVRI